MNQPLPDDEERDRSRSIAEQCWLGPLCLLFWAIIIFAVIHGCARGAECTLEWDANPPDQQVTQYRVYLGLTLLAETSDTKTTVMLPDAPCTVSVVAINAAGTSAPTTMKVSYLTDSESADLRAWSLLRGYHREFIPGRRFYRTRIETPP